MGDLSLSLSLSLSLWEIIRPFKCRSSSENHSHAFTSLFVFFIHFIAWEIARASFQSLIKALGIINKK